MTAPTPMATRSPTPAAADAWAAAPSIWESAYGPRDHLPVRAQPMEASETPSLGTAGAGCTSRDRISFVARRLRLMRGLQQFDQVCPVPRSSVPVSAGPVTVDRSAVGVRRALRRSAARSRRSASRSRASARSRICTSRSTRCLASVASCPDATCTADSAAGVWSGTARPRFLSAHRDPTSLV